MVSQFAPVKRQPAYVQVFQAIENEILSGRLNDGDPIPTELELCRQFDVQRSTVREGIRLLEQTGLVRRANGKRLMVARPRFDEAAELTRRGLERHGVKFVDVWEAISTLETATVRLAAKKATADHISALKEITRKLETAEQNDDVVKFGVSYLSAVGAATGNKVIAILIRSMNLLGRASLARVIDDLPDAQNRILRAQHEITAALESRNGNGAAEWMARHVDDLQRGYVVAGVDLETEVGMFDRNH
ncbi:MAG: GntR family transcriptional regulator [Pseudomonadota bacterium]